MALSFPHSLGQWDSSHSDVQGFPMIFYVEEPFTF